MAAYLDVRMAEKKVEERVYLLDVELVDSLVAKMVCRLVVMLVGMMDVMMVD